MNAFVRMNRCRTTTVSHCQIYRAATIVFASLVVASSIIVMLT